MFKGVGMDSIVGVGGGVDGGVSTCRAIPSKLCLRHFLVLLVSDSLPEGQKALEEDWERAGSGAALVLTNQWLL